MHTLAAHTHLQRNPNYTVKAQGLKKEMHTGVNTHVHMNRNEKKPQA